MYFLIALGKTVCMFLSTQSHASAKSPIAKELPPKAVCKNLSLYSDPKSGGLLPLIVNLSTNKESENPNALGFSFNKPAIVTSETVVHPLLYSKLMQWNPALLKVLQVSSAELSKFAAPPSKPPP